MVLCVQCLHALTTSNYPPTHQDGIWGVRKACAESLVAFSSALPQALRAKHLVPVFERFANDQSKWVRLAAFHHLGPFLSTLESAAVSWHSCCCCCYHSVVLTLTVLVVGADHTIAAAILLRYGHGERQH